MSDQQLLCAARDKMLFLLKESGGFEEKQLQFWLVNPTFTATLSQELLILTAVNLLVMNQKS